MTPCLGHPCAPAVRQVLHPCVLRPPVTALGRAENCKASRDKVTYHRLWPVGFLVKIPVKGHGPQA